METRRLHSDGRTGGLPHGNENCRLCAWPRLGSCFRVKSGDVDVDYLTSFLLTASVQVGIPGNSVVLDLYKKERNSLLSISVSSLNIKPHRTLGEYYSNHKITSYCEKGLKHGSSLPVRAFSSIACRTQKPITPGRGCTWTWWFAFSRTWILQQLPSKPVQNGFTMYSLSLQCWRWGW